MFFCVGSQTAEAYSSWGRTRAWYATSQTLWDFVFIFIWTNPSDRFALVATLSTCVFQLRLLETSTPKYLALLATPGQDLTMQYALCVKRGPGCSHPDDMALWALNSISHLLSQACSLSRSLCKVSRSFLFSSGRYMAVSSAKRRTWEIMSWGRSLM